LDELEEEKEEQEDKGAFALDAGDSLYSVDILEEVEEKESKRFSRTDSHASKRRVSRRKGRMSTNTSCADLFFLWRWRQTVFLQCAQAPPEDFYIFKKTIRGYMQLEKEIRAYV
jgi:hypothetical protein